MNDKDNANWSGPLSDIRVLDLTRVLAGPAAALALADLGAEVIKVEPPGGGDETRSFPPFRDGESHYYLAINRGKKSIVVDLKTERGVELIKELVASCDVLIENYRPGVMGRLGLGYDELSAINPKLIYCSISGFGQYGPLRDRPSFDIVLQALSGAMSVNGAAGGEPTKLGIPLGDLVGGINGPIGILAALHERHATGKGRHIDVSLLDGMIGMLGYLAQLSFFTGEDPVPQGSQHPNLVPYGSFAASDGAIIIACLTNSFWGRICRALGLEDYEHDPRYNSLEQRRERRDEVNAMIEGVTAGMTVKELEAILNEHQVPNAPILGVGEALAQPQVVARNMVINTPHSHLGEVPIVNRSIQFSDAAQAAPTPPPTLGEHTDAVLSSALGLSAAEIAELKSSGVIG